MLRLMAVTMQDIARDLKVSVVTVSKALRHKGNISAATRERVLLRAKQLNYQMNWVARSLVTRKTFTIGLLLPDIRHPFFAEIAKAVMETVRSEGYHVIVSYFDEDPEQEANEAESLMARQVDGLVVASAQARGNEMFRNIRSRKIPFVLIDRPVPGVRSSFVGADNELIGKLATEHLIEQGCQRIAHLRGPDIGIAVSRLQGFRRAMAQHKLGVPAHYVVEARYYDDMGYSAMKTLLGAEPVPDGVFCYNDPVAIGAIKAICEAGLAVPDDIKVIGAGNVRYSEMLAVPLSTLDQGAVEIGTCAAQMLLGRITAKRAPPPKIVLIPPKLVVRRSSQLN